MCNIDLDFFDALALDAGMVLLEDGLYNLGRGLFIGECPPGFVYKTHLEAAKDEAMLP